MCNIHIEYSNVIFIMFCRCTMNWILVKNYNWVFQLMMGYVCCCEGYPLVVQQPSTSRCISKVEEGDKKSTFYIHSKFVFIGICNFHFVWVFEFILDYSIGVKEDGTMDPKKHLVWRRYSSSIIDYIQIMISKYETALFVHSVEPVNRIFLYT